MDAYCLLKNSNWVLTTADAAEDILADFPDEESAILGALDLDLNIIPKPVPAQPKKKQVKLARDMEIGHLFRVANMWYRMVKFEGKDCIVDVVGENAQIKLVGGTQVTEISVLSLK